MQSKHQEQWLQQPNAERNRRKRNSPAKLSNFRITNKTISKRNSKPTLPLHRRLVPHTYCYYYYYPNILGIKVWYWPQGLLSMPTDNRHKYWETPSDKT